MAKRTPTIEDEGVKDYHKRPEADTKKVLPADIAHSLAEIRTRVGSLRGGMQTHEVQDVTVQIQSLLDSLEEEVWQEVGSVAAADPGKV